MDTIPKHFILRARSLITPKAIDIPSNVEVPLPSSSIIIKDFYVASLIIVRAYYISMKKVDLPSESLSLAPILVNTLSNKWHL